MCWSHFIALIAIPRSKIDRKHANQIENIFAILYLATELSK